MTTKPQFIGRRVKAHDKQPFLSFHASEYGTIVDYNAEGQNYLIVFDHFWAGAQWLSREDFDFILGGSDERINLRIVIDHLRAAQNALESMLKTHPENIESELEDLTPEYKRLVNSLLKEADQCKKF